VKSALALLVVAALALLSFGASAHAVTLPDERGYELITPPEKEGVTAGFMFGSTSGDVVDWLGLGGCCNTTTGGEELYQARRDSGGWSTTGVTPAPKRNLESLIEPQTAVYWTPDLGKTIFNTVESYDPADTSPGTLNLYLVDEGGLPQWVSRGPLSAQATPSGVTFDGATPDANTIVFSTQEQLTEDANGLLESFPTPSEYLYARNVSSATTSLVNITNAGAVVDPHGATLGDGDFLGQGTVAPNILGTTSHAVSNDGTKVFFQSPPSRLEGIQPPPQPHLYMRDLASGKTTPLDEPQSSGFARFQGASEDGSLVFFTSNEGLAGDPFGDLELYAFNTTPHQIGALPPMSAIPISAGELGSGPLDGKLLGETAIANDGSYVYFVAEGVLANSPNQSGSEAVPGKPNLYAFDTATGRTSFVGTVAAKDASAEGVGTLVSEPDLSRLAVPTPDGSALVFGSAADLTGQNPEGPATILASEASAGATTIQVTSTSGLLAKREVEIGPPPFAEHIEIASIDGETELTLAHALTSSYEAGAPLTQLGVYQVYRYTPGDGDLICISCAPPGVPNTFPAFVTGDGGSYAAGGLNPTMSADATRIFFMSEQSLAPGDEHEGVLQVYEWEDGHIALISDGGSTSASFLFGTTPTADDVFFATAGQLLPQDIDHAIDMYDARVKGGFPTPPSTPPSCVDVACRGVATPWLAAPEPGSATLSGEAEAPPPPLPAPGSFSVARITAAQRASIVRAWRLKLAVKTSGPGRISARAMAAGRLVGSSSVSFTRGDVAKTLTLKLSRQARITLARRGKLTLRIELRYSGSQASRMIELELVGPRSQPARRTRKSALGRARPSSAAARDDLFAHLSSDSAPITLANIRALLRR
jgi:hypothetical protein